jgi:mono/diheme cytochrome c family protein
MPGFRPIRVPQLAPIAPIQTGVDIQPPLAPPQPFELGQTRPTFYPPGVTPRPGQPFQYNPNLIPGQPLQPVPPQFAQPAAPQPTQPASYLAWDAELKEAHPKVGDATAQFTFWLTNVSKEVVAIHTVHTSCGCTVAQLPAQPWKVEPGAGGPINVTMNLAGKMGTVEKGVTVNSTTGLKTLIVRSYIPAQTNAQPTIGGIDVDRLKNMQMALADRQVVFRGECAKCHAEPTQGKTGEQLYVVACGICHDSVHRATMVPDLKNLRHPTNDEHWRKWTRSGRPGSMMPAFSKSEGGPLTDEQIDSLVKFLMDTITAKAAPTSVPLPAIPARAQATEQPRESASAFSLPSAKTKVQ